MWDSWWSEFSDTDNYNFPCTMFACFYDVIGLTQKQKPCMNITQTTVTSQSHGLGLDIVSLLYHKDIIAKTNSLAFSKLTHKYRSHAVT